MAESTTMVTPKIKSRIAMSIALLLVVALCTVAGWEPYVRPQIDTPRTADAIVVLGGAHDGREQTGLKLAEEGYAPQVVFSNPYGNSPYMSSLCNGRYDFEVMCFDPKPSTTRGEGQEIARRAAEGNWKSVIVVTFTPHISRARYIIGKCWDGDVMMVESPTDLPISVWAWNYVYQTAGFIRSAIEGC